MHSESLGDVNIGTENGENGYLVQDQELSQIILGLVPDLNEKRPENLSLILDKYVFFQVILTYLYNKNNKI